MIFKVLLVFFSLVIITSYELRHACRQAGVTSYELYAQQEKAQAPKEQAAVSQNQESDQQISEFSLGGYGDKGKKTWDIAGKTADIFDNVIKLQDVVANMYGEEEDIKLTAEKGDFDKVKGKVHVEENVIITTSAGSKLTTDSLDWDRKNKVVSTKDVVNITRDNMVTVARGAVGQPNLNQVTLEKDVQVNINPVRNNPDKSRDAPPTAGTSNGVNPKEEAKEGIQDNKTIITCDGPLEIDYAKNIATFKNNVKVDTKDNIIYSDLMDVYFLSTGEASPTSESEKKAEDSSSLMGTKIDKIICRGNVKIIRGENISYSENATYTAFDKRIVLTGRPRLILYSTEELSASFGN